jgi:hypothetical protein
MTPAQKRAGAQGFYEDALGEAEAQNFPRARDVDGFEEEIAVLRLRLRTTLEKRPEDLQLMLRGMEVLRKLVISRYGLKPDDQEGLPPFAQETLRRLKERAEGGAN